MDSFFIEYRDPLFGVIVLFSIVFIVSFSNYWWGVYKLKGEEASIEKFIKRFELTSAQEAYKELLHSFKLSPDSLCLLAHAHVKSGELETATEIYLIALKNTQSRSKKRFILVELAKVYFKLGFLQRSQDTFLQSLKSHPRDKEALSYLNVCYERLKEYKLALGALEALEELGADVKDEKAYMSARMIACDKKLKVSEKVELLKPISLEFSPAKRMIIELKHSNNTLDAKDFDGAIALDLLDFVWYLQDENLLKSLKDPVFVSVARLKGLSNSMECSNIFELEVLNNLKDKGYDKASLGFEFGCEKCKQNFPIHFYRCPSCHSLNTIIVEPILEQVHETHIPFL